MSFASSRQQAPLTNVEEQEEKQRLLQDHAELRLKINEAQGQISRSQDLTQELEEKKALVAEKSAFLNELIKNIADCQKDLQNHKEIIQNTQNKVKNSQAELVKGEEQVKESEAVLKEIHKRHDKIVGDLPVRQAALDSLQKMSDLLTTTIDAQKKKSSELASALQLVKDERASIEKDVELAVEQYEEITEKIRQGGSVIRAQADEISLGNHTIAQQAVKAEKLVEEAREKAEVMLDEAQQTNIKRLTEIMERESAVGLRETWHKEKVEKANELKMELEKHLGKPIKINFA